MKRSTEGFRFNINVIFFTGIILIRVLAMSLVPLTDTTEARYGEIARKMVETGDWITLWHEYGIPFWAKPPLSTWLSAASMHIFGINEFAARLPALLLAVAVSLLIWHFSGTWLKRSSQWLSLIILTSMTLFYVSSGTVMTDMPLLFTCTLALVAFWFAIDESSVIWGYVFFAALGLGLLVKGPAAILLSLLPIFFWLFWSSSWKRMWSSLPWVGGLLLVLLISMPWYILAEIRTPGFLNYFIVGEHLSRFLVSSWQGDLYGNAHNESLGTIWFFLLIDALPWLLIIIPWAVYQKIKPTRSARTLSQQQKYLWCWFLSPLIFFSFAHNIILTYTLTALPALALIGAQWLAPIAIRQDGIQRWVYLVGLFSPCIILILVFLNQARPDLTKKSAREISYLFHDIRQSDNSRLSYVGKRLYSMDFYNAGKVIRFESVKEMLTNNTSKQKVFLALTQEQRQSLTAAEIKQLKYEASTSRYLLYSERKGSQ